MGYKCKTTRIKGKTSSKLGSCWTKSGRRDTWDCASGSNPFGYRIAWLLYVDSEEYDKFRFSIQLAVPASGRPIVSFSSQKYTCALTGSSSHYHIQQRLPIPCGTHPHYVRAHDYVLFFLARGPLFVALFK